VGALIPATALGRSHHRRHHHARVHHKIRHKQFGRTDAPTTSAMSDNAGTVTSFDGTKLTITLADQSTVTGTVTNDTEIECDAADTSSSSSSSQTSFHRDDQGGDNSGSGDQGDNNDQGDDDNNQMGSCDTSALTPGTVVHEAELKLSGAGAVWDKVELLTSSSSSSSSGDDD
jgi:hypothetical protein